MPSSKHHMDHSKQLVQQAQQGDRQAFEQLVQESYPIILATAYKFSGMRQDAEDIAQIVCMDLPRMLAKFSHRSQFSTWLYRIVVNRCRDWIKKHGNQTRLQSGYAEFSEAERADDAAQNSKVAWLYRAIAALKPPLDETGLLVLGEELSHAEAGQILGCAESTISWRMHRIRKLLTQQLSSYYEE